MTAMPGDLTKRLDLFDLLERMCQALEPGVTQQDRARSSYEAIGQFLAGATDPAFSGVEIAPQGSVVLGTMTKPVGRLEYDVDLLCRLKRIITSNDPAGSVANMGHGRAASPSWGIRQHWRNAY